MATSASSARDNVWTFGPVQEITYTTVTFPLRVDTIERLAAVEIMMAAWSLMRPEQVDAVSAIKGFYRRRQDWLTLELVAPESVNRYLPEFVAALFDSASCAELVEPARGVAVSALRATADRNGLIAGELGWGGVLGRTPAALRVPTEAELEGVSVANVVDVLATAATTAKTMVVSGSDGPLPDIGPLDRRASVKGAAVQPSAGVRLGRGSGTLLTRESHGTAAIRLLLPAGSVGDMSLFYGLLTLCVPLGGTHYSLLAKQLRDELGLAYLPSVTVEAVSDELYIVAAWDAEGDAVASSIERAILLISGYFQDGEWRHHWRAGQAQVLSIYEDSWSDARGKGVFVTSSIHALGSFPGYGAIIDAVRDLSEASLSSAVSRIDIGQMSGAIAGDFDAASLRSIANVYGLQVRQLRGE